MPHIFTYGSLMFDQVWNTVVRSGYETRRAILTGYARACVKGEEYPVIYPGERADSVAGLVYLDVGDRDLRRLDDFEGIYYQRQTLTVRSVEGDRLNVQAYVVKEAYHHIIDRRDWDPERFRTAGIRIFLSRYGGFEADQVNPRSERR